MTTSTDRNLGYCAIDFGTSNSAIAVPSTQGMQLVALEDGHATMPTAVFYCTDADDLPPAAQAVPGATNGADLPRCFGRAAVQAYVQGYEGRLMRSMKSILGSALVDQTTDLGHGWGVKYLDIVTGYLRRLRECAQDQAGRAIERAVLGRPVFFVDDDPARDAQAQASLEAAARAVGFTEIAFQYEPIAAAFDYERGAAEEELVLVADIGGGTSDFSVVRVGPQRMGRLDRRDDILASHGVHVAGTDFDRRVSLACLMPTLGYGSYGPATPERAALPVPARVYFDLTTWHLINSVYQPARMAELRAMRDWYADPAHHRRLMKVLNERLGHALAGRAEAAKIAVAAGGGTDVELALVEAGLHAPLTQTQAAAALDEDVQRIVDCAGETVRRAGVTADVIGALYFTGGSTGLQLLTTRLEAAFPQARAVHGERLSSVATGLGLHAERLYSDRGSPNAGHR
ncbi:MAG: Hsp70 family protein [Aquabacterium sp.]|nr:MAG: Hsp70 family protein [Aquabacterium sp.]